MDQDLSAWLPDPPGTGKPRCRVVMARIQDVDARPLLPRLTHAEGHDRVPVRGIAAMPTRSWHPSCCIHADITLFLNYR